MGYKDLITSCASAALLAISFNATAQETDAEAPAERESAVARVLNKVTVSATKKADVEDVQTVPVSVTAFNEDTLEALKVRDLQSLSYSSPNVSLDDLGTSRGTQNFSIRGLGINSSIPSIDPAVGVFVDGIYLGVNNGLVMDLFDLESVEILRGPQGLLFGRNTTGGAVLVNTGNPTDEFRAKARVAVDGPVDSGRGGPNTYVQGLVSGPIVEGKLNGKIGAYYNGDEGYFKNLFNGDNQGEAQTYIVRGALEWFASDTVTFLAKAEHFQSRGDGAATKNRGVFERDNFDFAIDAPGEYDSETTFATLRTDIDVDFGNGTITNILGYRSFEGTTLGDIDALPAFLFHSNTEMEQEQISNELRYAGTFGKAEVTTGLFYFDQEVTYTEVRDLPPRSPLTFYGGGRQDHQVLGIFGQVDYNFTPDFVGILGLRYSKETKDAGITYIRPRPACSVVDGTCPTDGTNGFIPGESNGFEDDDSWSNWTPRLGFQYFYNDATQFYGSYTKGYRSGGYNFRITNPAAFEELFPADASRAFDEEEVDSFELGVKYETDDGRGQLNTSVFLNKIKNMQREVNLSSPTLGIVQNIVNTADADILGLEVEGRYAFTDNFLMTANIGLIDAEYQDVDADISGDGAVDGEDLALAIPRVPEATYGIGFIYDLDLGAYGSLVSRANFQHKDEFAYTDTNFGWIPEHDELSANITWNTAYNGLSLSLYGNNLLDEVTAGGDTQIPFGGDLSNGVDRPFDEYPSAGTFYPLKKGRVVGLELVYEY
ncbi:TonB-dependent receptor [Ponticaulis profundi]|uniref:TonB-dependent receptor n=1 Tax=Ponticaulis profundi TaxID=2665222 RepID=A0ABW1S4Q8_9PROT